MPPPGENRKRKNDDPSPTSQQQSDTASVLSNLPTLPPPPDASPPPTSQPTSQPPTQPPTAAQTSVTTTTAPPPTSSKSRPKRARSKADKKDDNEKQSRFHCDYCARDLSWAVRARCAVCPDYDSCLDCFSVGAALAPHSADHAYRLIEVVHTPIYQIGWGADEEEKLLEGLEIYGVGNWEQVAKLIGTPLPDPQRTVPAEKTPPSEAIDDMDPKALRVMHKHQQEDAAGWMPKREDFVYEWDNDAEDIIGDMEILDDDCKSDKELKIQVLEIYCQKLEERKKRKDFVHERVLTDVKTHQVADKKRNKEEREFREKLKVFMRFVPRDEMEKFINKMMEEHELRARITMLKDGRNQGARSIEECERLHANALKKLMRANTNTAANVSTASATPSNTPAGEPSVLSGTSQRRARRSNGEGSMSEATAQPSSNSTTAPSNGHAGMGTGKISKGTILQDIEAEQLPGSELLSSSEITLCRNLNLTPHQYMIVKEIIIRESARSGLRKKDARAIVKLDGAKVFKIYEFLQSCGWLRFTPAGSASAASHGAAAPKAPARMMQNASAAVTWNALKSQTDRS